MLPVVALLVLLAGGASAVAPEDREALAASLVVLRSGFDPQAAKRAIEILDRGDLDVEGLAAFFRTFLAEHALTLDLARFLGDRALLGEASARRRNLQEALAPLAAQEIDAVLRSELPDGMPTLAADRQRFEHLQAATHLLGRIAAKGELSAGSRRELYARLRDLIAAYPTLLRKETTVDPAREPRLAAVRAQLYKHLQDLLVPFDARRFIADAGFHGDYAELVRNHGVLVLDNNGLDARQRRAIREVLALIPPDLHGTRHISVYELLGNRRGEVILPLSGSLGVNLFDISVATHTSVQFPEEIAAAPVPGFCSVLQHELNHAVDAATVETSPRLTRRRDQLIARAGSNPQQYLRSMLEPGYFVAHPNEFFASIASSYFSDSFKTLELALRRLESGTAEPLNQLLFFAGVYARGHDSVPFVVQDADCEFALHPIPLGRDDRGRIVRLDLPGESTLRFELDDAGNVLR